MKNKAISLFSLIIILTFISVGLQSLRGGSASLAITSDHISNEDLKKISKELNENQGFVKSYLYTLSSILTFNFGKNVHNQEIAPIVFSALLDTITLAVMASTFALLYGLITGVMGYYFEQMQPWLQQLNFIILSTPIFIISLLLIWVFALYLKWLPPGGKELSGWMLLPMIALGLRAGSRLSVFITDYFKDELSKVYVLSASAFGISKLQIYFVLILKNVMLPAVSFWLLDFASYLAGTAIIETIHNINGLGSLLLKAIHQYDLKTITGIVTITSLMVFCITLIQELIDRYYQKFSPKK